MKKRPPLTKTDLFFVLTALVGIILFWIEIDPNGYLLYSSLIIMTLKTLFHQLTDKQHVFRYSKWLLIIIVTLIVLTGIDRMTLKKLSPMLFTLCYILYILIQPKPAWITRP